MIVSMSFTTFAAEDTNNSETFSFINQQGELSAIVGILTFTGGLYLSYDQAIELETYTFDYHYRVRVEGDVYFTAERNITYWRIANVTEGTLTYEEKSFNYGFSMANTEMVKFGIDAYLESTQ